MLKVKVCVQGEMDEHWMNFLEGFALSTGSGQTVLEGELSDQAALYGLMAKLRDLGVNLVEVGIEEL